ncbi:Thiol-disulfide isomerase or thioredoxin [Lutibacter oricola]|uniref:Thiol-disulfide isomerase or thioredoxin n=1 Tax=Lutibacter oricola TaxID=762486 RepID=A0A1H2T3L5_9FLAO|nr:thioredoxin family protein [Lutibacter oricola]SDW37869.1 Thiol-disulfide isomerase or thioredoxin [Lutibacter oricola]
MKNLLLLSLLTLLISCKIQKKTTKATTNNDGDLIGIAIKSNFLVEPHKDWFDFSYNDYTPNKEIIKQLKPLINSVKIKTFMGTWCGDSQEQIPVFYKVLEATEFNFNNLEMVTVNRKKKAPKSLQKGFNIIRVPTIIIFKNNEEIGRLVEYPRETIEADLLKIISGKPYKHSYEE